MGILKWKYFDISIVFLRNLWSWNNFVIIIIVTLAYEDLLTLNNESLSPVKQGKHKDAVSMIKEMIVW